METADKRAHFRPCVFLGPDERCTIYEDRPSVCGFALASSPAAFCGTQPDGVEKISSPKHEAIVPQFEREFCMRAGLRRIALPYSGALPRMVLIALEAWDRRDYVQFLADRCLPASQRLRNIMTR
jgi:hypothetical protein